ncbi:HlyD family secretion protein [Moorella sulfitireducens]|uniref:HlyD family secretion protein n=1 Tax=Neomoorella sulfitireducens TaxID=2972948 RepID=UPI0021ABF7DA|nr:HlyD family efflux transporter periplasmic adaptor subunit [Moorella sulfitireducens]
MATGAVPVTPPRSHKGKWLVGACLVILLGGAILWWQHGRNTGVTYITMPAGQGNIKNTINATGSIEPVKSVTLGFKTGGIIKAIYVKPGDAVKAGQVLALQDTTELEAQLAQAQASYNSALANLQKLEAGATAAEIIQAEASVETARIAYNNAAAAAGRSQALYEAGALSKAELDSAISERDSAAAKLRQAEAALEELKNGSRPEEIAAAQAQVEVARAQLTLAQNNFDGARVRAPWDGIISAVNGEVGYRVGSSDSGSGFITLITEELQVRARVNEADINEVKVGQEVTLTVNALPGEEIPGKVAWIAPEAQTISNVQLYEVVISIDKNKSQSLRAGMTASVDFIIARKDNVLTIPRAALTFARNYSASSLQNGGTTAGGDTAAPGSRTAGSSKQGGSAPGGGANRGSGQESGTASTNTGAGTSAAGAGEAGTAKAIVLVLENGRPVPRQVVTGVSDASNVEVVSGLQAGEAVIIGTSTTSGKTAGNSTSSSTSNQTRTPVTPGPMMGPPAGAPPGR